jgi:hypothetical protein
MADNQIQSNKPGKKELSMEQRLLLAFVLMGLVLFLTPYFYKSPPPAPKTTAPVASQTAPATSVAVPKSPEAAASFQLRLCRDRF